MATTDKTQIYKWIISLIITIGLTIITFLVTAGHTTGQYEEKIANMEENQLNQYKRLSEMEARYFKDHELIIQMDVKLNYIIENIDELKDKKYARTNNK